MQFLSLFPNGVFLTHCAPHLGSSNISILSCACKEVDAQSIEWKHAHMVGNGIPASIDNARALWKSYYCRKVPAEELPLIAEQLMGMVTEYVTRELKMLYPDVTRDRDPAWRIERNTFFRKTLGNSGLMSTESGRNVVGCFVVSAAETMGVMSEQRGVADWIERRFLGDTQSDEEREAPTPLEADTNISALEAAIGNIPVEVANGNLLRAAIARTMPRLLCQAVHTMLMVSTKVFVIDEEDGVVNV
jgi:hypothetical protein